MSSPVYKIMSRQGGGRQGGMQRPQSGQQGGDDPRFMQFAEQLNQFGNSFQGDPEQMVMGALNDGRITQKQFDMVQGMAKKIQRMLVSMGF